MTQTTLRVNVGPDAATQIGAQAGRAIRTYGKPVTTIQRPAARPQLPWRREDLFREPAYEDGKPYTDDDEDEDDEPPIITP